MPETVLYTPFDMSDAVPAGRRRFWKQILPVKKIKYKGQDIDFDPQFHMDLADSFRKEAFDQVPLVFADGENRHNMNPKNFGGDILDMQARPNGTWALIEADKEAAAAIEKNPKLGVSARIRQGLEKADGRKFGRAVEHVLLTMNPRLSLEPWQAVDLSDEDADLEVVDLTSYTYKEGKAMPKTATKTKTARKAGGKPAKLDLSLLDDDQFQQLIDLAAAATEEGEVEDLDEDLEDAELEDPTAPKRKKKSRTKIVIDKDEEDSKDDAEDDPEDDGTDLSDRLEALETNFTQAQIDLAEANWARERDQLIDAGVPPFLVDLAEPLLSLPGAMTIDLADGDESVNATQIVRSMLEGVHGILDLTDEIGHSVDLSDAESEEAKEATAFLDEWNKQYS